MREALFEVAELLSEASVRFEKVEGEGSGVVGFEEFCPLGQSPALSADELLPVYAGVLPQIGDLLSEASALSGDEDPGSSTSV